MGAVVFAGLGSASLAGSAAADTTPTPNSVVAVGPAPQFGPDHGLVLHAGVVGIASDPAVPGYWLAAGDGGVFTFGQAPFLGSAANVTLNAPIVGIAASPDGRGYWLVGADGGVFTFGDAAYYGSTASSGLGAPIVAIVATHDGGGYWLVAADGGVFAFGNAAYLGSAAGLQLASPVVAAAATADGKGYWLLGADGGVFAFGDARFTGAQPDPSSPAVGISPAPGGNGYWIARADGRVSGFGVAASGSQLAASAATSPVPGTGNAQTVGIATAPSGGYWLAEGPAAPAAAPPATPSSDPFLVCTRAHESDGAGGYGAVSPGGTYRGAYQFDQGTWNSAALLAGRPDLAGTDPAAASVADQDLLALTLFHSRGTQPWGGRCGGMP